MIGYKSIVEQGWKTCKHIRFDPDMCPYPRNSQSSKEWLDGHFKANRGEHWNTLPLRKEKKRRMITAD